MRHLFEHKRSHTTAAPVLPDEGSSILTRGAGELFKQPFISDELWTVIVHVTDKERQALRAMLPGGKLLV